MTQAAQQNKQMKNGVIVWYCMPNVKKGSNDIGNTTRHQPH